MRNIELAENGIIAHTLELHQPQELRYLGFRVDVKVFEGNLSAD